jgi:uncharacterized protein (UPF0332 family)
MKDEPAKALEEAKIWLKTAEMALKEANHNKASIPVACAEAIHSIIRANDALTLHFLGKKSTRHDDAPYLFLELIKQGKLERKDDAHVEFLMQAMRSKSGADYGKEEFTLKQAEYFVSKANEYLDFVERKIK